MDLKKLKSTSEFELCMLCEKPGIYHNVQNISVCKKHKKTIYNNLTCACGEKIEILPRESGALFNCSNCGDIGFERAREHAISSFYDSKKPKSNKLTKENVITAKKILEEIPDEQAFIVCDGTTLSSLELAADYLRYISHEAFNHHVNSEKNDFHSWIAGVFGDDVLSNKIRDVKTKEELQERIDDRVKELKRISV